MTRDWLAENLLGEGTKWTTATTLLSDARRCDNAAVRYLGEEAAGATGHLALRLRRPHQVAVALCALIGGLPRS